MNPSDLSTYPYMSVFWLVPVDKARLKLVEMNKKAIDSNQSMIPHSGSNGSNGNEEADSYQSPVNATGIYKRISPVDALHELAGGLRNWYSKNESYTLGAKKIYHDVILSILKHDNSSLDEFDMNELMIQFDMLSLFVMELDVDIPGIDIQQKFREFTLRIEEERESLKEKN